jgi:uncharacterized protein (TIGR03435 family)
MLVQYAFNVQSFQVSGGPRWMDEDKYEVVALPPATSKSAEARPAVINEPPNDEQRKMLQSLLIDRFGLKFHREIKEGPVYVLVRSNKKLQMEDAKNKKEIPWVAVVIERNGVEGGMAGNNATMSLMATRLSRYLERPVLDRTGLKGSFDFELAAPEESSYDVINGIFDSVIRLGLKLKADKGPVETVVIDRAMKPMEN